MSTWIYIGKCPLLLKYNCIDPIFTRENAIKNQSYFITHFCLFLAGFVDSKRGRRGGFNSWNWCFYIRREIHGKKVKMIKIDVNMRATKIMPLCSIKLKWFRLCETTSCEEQFQFMWNLLECNASEIKCHYFIFLSGRRGQRNLVAGDKKGWTFWCWILRVSDK